MIESLSLLTIGVALGVGLAAAIELLGDRRRARLAELTELQRHQALPPVPPEAWTGDTARLAPYGAQPTPDQEIAGRRWEGRRMRRRGDPQNWRNN